MVDSTSAQSDLREDIALNEALLDSLPQGTESEPQRQELSEKLDQLKAKLDAMEPNWRASVPEWGNSPYRMNQAFNNGLRPPSSNGSASAYSNNSFSSTNQGAQSFPMSATLPDRKRQRFDDDCSLPSSKSRKATPVPPTESSFNFDDNDFANDPLLRSLFGDDWEEEERRNKEYLDELEAKKRQEEEDAAFARQLQQQWNESFEVQPPSEPPAASNASYNQSFMQPDGSWQKPSSQHIPSRVKPDPNVEVILSENATPQSEASSGIEEISVEDYMRQWNRFDNASSSKDEIPVSAPSIPGTFPTPSSATYVSAPGSSVYEAARLPYQGLQSGVRSASDSIGNVIQYLGSLSGSMSMPGSANSPFNLDSFGSSSTFLRGQDSYANPAQTQEELRELLKHIRPDEELTEEQLRQVQPEGLRINLMRHQQKGFAWMKSMEEGTNKGGILADDMGLGKTVQAISLILARKPEPPSTRKPTLVVAPVALMQQWAREIEKFVKPTHKLSVLVLHQENRNRPWNYIRDYDVILTTYGTLASDLKRKIAWDEHVKKVPDAKPKPFQECPLLGSRSAFHRIILDEAQNIKNKSTKAAMAACHVKADYRWCLSGTPMQNNVDEIYSLIKFCRIRPYHDYEKFAKDIGRPLKRASEYTKEKAMKQLQVILKAILLRRTKKSEIDGQPIIQLPEKHTVEDRAVFSKDELDFYQQLEKQAQIQFNRFLKNGTVGRYYSHALVLLLRLRQCCCSPQLVTNAKDFLTSGPLGEVDRIENAKKLPTEVLRRLDENDAYECPICMDAVENPIVFVPCGHTLCNECLTAMADKSMTDAQPKVSCPHCRAGVDLNAVTDLESYLRVYHPEREGVRPIDEEGDDSDDSDDLDGDSSESEVEEDDPTDDGKDLDDFIVPDDDIEYESDASDVVEDRKQILDYIKKDKDTKPLEATPKPTKKSKSKDRSRKKGKGKAKDKFVSLADLRKEGLKSKAAKKRYLRRLAKGFEPSTKIDKTISLLEEIKHRGQGEKTIVFSSFTSFLDLLEVPLSQHNELAAYARYDGSMKASDRNASLLRFTDDPRCKVILVSLKAGNSGLNLTAANHVIILDPFWNPFVEYQAADRCYRIGQLREVTVHRVLIGEHEDQEPDPERDFTVEDRILRLQEKKRALVDAALDENAATSLGRLTTRDLGFLFGVNGMD